MSSSDLCIYFNSFIYILNHAHPILSTSSKIKSSLQQTPQITLPILINNLMLTHIAWRRWSPNYYNHTTYNGSSKISSRTLYNSNSSSNKPSHNKHITHPIFIFISHHWSIQSVNLLLSLFFISNLPPPRQFMHNYISTLYMCFHHNLSYL